MIIKCGNRLKNYDFKKNEEGGEEERKKNNIVLLRETKVINNVVVLKTTKVCIHRSKTYKPSLKYTKLNFGFDNNYMLYLRLCRIQLTLHLH